MYEYGVSFKSVRYLQDYGSFHFCSRCVTVFFTNDEKSWVRINYAVISQCVKILFFAQSLRCLKICMVNPLMTFIFSKLGNMLHSDTPLIVGIITEGCGIWEKSTVSYPQKFCRFSLRDNSNFHRMLFLGSYNPAWWKLQDDTFPLVCALYWYINVLAC